MSGTLAIVHLEQHSKGAQLQASLMAVHTHECKGWRLGKKRKPCTCGATELWEMVQQQIDKYPGFSVDFAPALIARSVNAIHRKQTAND